MNASEQAQCDRCSSNSTCEQSDLHSSSNVPNFQTGFVIILNCVKSLSFSMAADSLRLSRPPLMDREISRD
jgi:hypothetical protein